MGRIDREGPIHRSIISYLRVTLPGAVVYHPPNEVSLRGKAVARAIAKAKWNGATPGYPDIICHFQGRTMLFEVKAKGNYLAPAQKAMRADIEAQNIPYAVVRSIDDVTVSLAEWGVAT
jgi:hypothetical protein